MRLTNPWSVAALVCALAACDEARDVEGFTGAQSSCASCHSAPDEGPPFRDAEGGTSPSLPSVGAHTAHLQADLSSPLECGACHTVPQTVSDPGHLEDRGPADVVFGALARARGASPTYGGATCAVYCHGQFTGGNAGNTPSWLGGPAAAECGTCHDAFPAGPPTGEHARHVVGESIACDTCHGPILQTTHVNGVVNLAVLFDPVTGTCQDCHGPAIGSWRD